jgi:hypothetical protein
MEKMYDDILGKNYPTCPDCLNEMVEYKHYLVCPNGCWEYHGDWKYNDGVWKVGIGN